MDLAITFAGVTFKNPLVVSAGSPTINPYTIRRCLEAGVVENIQVLVDIGGGAFQVIREAVLVINAHR